MVKVDLHTHSILSHDGGISEEQYLKAIKTGLLDQVAITDHDQIEFALRMNQRAPNSFIVGEEIMTTEGEVIGLFINQFIKPGLSLIETIKKIRSQEGIVYIPHPFDMRRSGVGQILLSESIDIDIVEIFNSRTLSSNTDRIKDLIDKYPTIAFSYGSDSHGSNELGDTVNVVQERLDKYNIVTQLRKAYNSHSSISKKVTIQGFLNPSINRVKKKLMGSDRSNT